MLRLEVTVLRRQETRPAIRPRVGADHAEQLRPVPVLPAQHVSLA